MTLPSVNIKTIDGKKEYTYVAFPNSNAGRTSLEHAIEYNKTSSGAFKFLQLLEKTSKAARMVFEEMGDSTAVFFGELSGKLGMATGMLGIPRLPDVTKKAWKAITSWGPVAGPEGYALRGHVENLNKVADCTSTWSYAVSLIFNNPEAKTVGDATGFVSDLTDATMAAQEYKMAGKYLKQIEAGDVAIKERFADTQKEALLRLVKAVLSVVTGALGLYTLAFGGPVLPAAVMLGMSLAATIFSMSAHFFKETRNYELVKFFEWNKPEVQGVRVN